MKCALVLILACCGNDFQTRTEEEMINGVPLTTFVEALDSKEQRAPRLHAMEVIARYASRPKEYIPRYLEGLNDPDEVVRAASAAGLGEMGNRIPSLVGEFLDQLGAALEDPQQRVRLAASQALYRIGPAARAQLPALRAHYQEDRSASVRESALSAIIAVTEGSDDYLAALLIGINQEEFPINAEWLRQLGGAGVKNEDAVAAARKVLRRKDEHADASLELIRRAAVSCLARMGTIAQAAVPDLFEMLGEPIKYRNVYAPRIPGEPDRSRVVVAREPTNFGLRLSAAWAITQVDPNAAPKLFELLNRQSADANPEKRLSTAIIVSRLGYLPSAKQLAARVKALTADDDPSVRTIANLAELRLADPQSSELDESYLSAAPLPKDDENLPNSEAMKQRLIVKLAELRKLCQTGDALAVARDAMLPTKFEKSLIQGDLISQMARDGKRKLGHLSESIEQAEHDKIELVGRVATVPTGARSRPLQFYWFSGRWYLSDN